MPFADWIPLIAAGVNAAGGAIANAGTKSRMAYAKYLQSRLMIEQSDINMHNALNMFNLENAYNHPLAMMQRELSAGMNPFAVASTSGAGRSTPADASTPEASAQSVPFSPVQNPFSDIGNVLSSAASALNSLSQKKGQDLTNEYTKETMQTLIDQAAANLKGTQFENAFKEVRNQFAPLVQKYGLQKEYAEGLKLLSEKDLNYQKIQETFQRALDLAEQRAKTREERLQIQEQRPIILNNLRKQGVVLDEQAKTERSKQASNFATAQNMLAQGNYYGALSATENALRDLKVSSLDAETQDKWNTFVYNANTLTSRVRNQEISTEKAVQELRFLEQQADNFAQSPLGKAARDAVSMFKDIYPYLKEGGKQLSKPFKK